MGVALFSLSCDGDDADCAEPLNIAAVEPDNNPAGYEVLIRGEGFTAGAVVRFGNVVADARRIDRDVLIAEVPGGIDGPVELSVQSGNCIARTGFEILTNYPSDQPLSAPFIIVPPLNIGFNSGIDNLCYNLADPDHLFCLDRSGNDFQTIGFNSLECHQTNPLLAGNRVEGEYVGDFESLLLRVIRDRETEIYDGYAIDPALVNSDSALVLFLVSRNTNRQLILQAADPNLSMPDCDVSFLFPECQ
jgi:hypothetical protein